MNVPSWQLKICITNENPALTATVCFWLAWIFLELKSAHQWGEVVMVIYDKQNLRFSTQVPNQYEEYAKAILDKLSWFICNINCTFCMYVEWNMHSLKVKVEFSNESRSIAVLHVNMIKCARLWVLVHAEHSEQVSIFLV